MPCTRACGDPLGRQARDSGRLLVVVPRQRLTGSGFTLARLRGAERNRRRRPTDGQGRVGRCDGVLRRRAPQAAVREMRAGRPVSPLCVICAFPTEGAPLEDQSPMGFAPSRALIGHTKLLVLPTAWIRPPGVVYSPARWWSPASSQGSRLFLMGCFLSCCIGARQGTGQTGQGALVCRCPSRRGCPEGVEVCLYSESSLDQVPRRPGAYS